MTRDPWHLASDLPSVFQALTSLQVPIPRPMPTMLRTVRTAIDSALHGTARIPDSAVTLPALSDGLPEWSDIRFGLYRLYQLLEEAAVGVEAFVGRTAGDQVHVGRILAQATAARWDLHGLLVPLETDDLDRPPGGGEWTLRETLAHIAVVQAIHTVNTAYWAYQPTKASARRATWIEESYITNDSIWPPSKEWLDGTLRELRQRLDTLLDLGIGMLRKCNDRDDLDKLALIWGSQEVSVRYCLHRFATHWHEHTIQVEKTLAMLRREPSEVERIARISFEAYGRLEGSLLCLPIDVLEQSTSEGTPLSDYLDDIVQTVTSIAAGVSAASLG